MPNGCPISRAAASILHQESWSGSAGSPTPLTSKGREPTLTAMKLNRPLAVFDLETTGISPAEDRIVEVALVRLLPDGSRETRSWLVNPGCKIPAGATAVHGIR